MDRILIRLALFLVIFVPAILFRYKIKSLSDYKRRDPKEKRKVIGDFTGSFIGLMITLFFD